MEPKKRLITVPYSSEHLSALEIFCELCERTDYKNNDTVSSMRLEWCLKLGGQFFLTYYDGKIISVSGCHPLPEVGPDVYRILFRGATLKEYQNLLGIMSKTHMTSIPFYSHIPLALEWAKDKASTFVVTTNWSNPNGIKSMSKSHNVLGLLARQNIVSCLIEKVNLFYTDQTVWKLNIDTYFTAREQFKQRNNLND
jgi:hypothetical protein